MSINQNTFIQNDYENIVCVTTGDNYFDVPSVPDVPEIFTNPISTSNTLNTPNVHSPSKKCYITKTDDAFKKEYFESILKDDIRIKIINGIPTNFDYEDLYCDYCDSNIGSMNKDEEISNGYWRCWDCQIDMCNLCHSEINEEIANQNGAKNYHLRKDKIQACLLNEENPHKLQKRTNTSFSMRGCDLCNESIGISDKFRWSEDPSKYDSKDICQKCSNTPNGMHHILLWKMQEVDTCKSLNEVWNNCEFGSIMDWIPIYKDDEYNMILVNRNPESKYYEDVCLMASDNHGRSGFFTIKIDLDELWRGMEVIYNEFCDKLKENNREDEISYLSPIQVVMESFNIPTYYG